MNSQWTPEAIEHVITSWRGNADSSTIASSLAARHGIHVSRSAVLGVIHRHRNRVGGRDASLSRDVAAMPKPLVQRGPAFTDYASSAYAAGASYNLIARTLTERHRVRIGSDAVAAYLCREVREGRLKPPPPKPKLAPVPRSPATHKPKVDKPAETADDGSPISLRLTVWQRTNFQCAWIEADPRVDSTMCGHPTVHGQAWCAFHFRRVLAQPPREADVGPGRNPLRSQHHAHLV